MNVSLQRARSLLSWETDCVLAQQMLGSLLGAGQCPSRDRTQISQTLSWPGQGLEGRPVALQLAEDIPEALVGGHGPSGTDTHLQSLSWVCEGVTYSPPHSLPFAVPAEELLGIQLSSSGMAGLWPVPAPGVTTMLTIQDAPFRVFHECWIQ